MTTDYEVITGTRVGELQSRVRERIHEGWEPIGGIAMLHEQDAVDQKPHIVFAQAIIRNGARRRIKTNETVRAGA